MTNTQNTADNIFAMLDATRERVVTPPMTAHSVAGYTVHADGGWRNGNSPTGLALAVHLHKSGAPTPSHVIHAEDAPCDLC